EARPAEEVRFALDPGDTLIVYTDGLVERRGELPDVGVARLAAAAREVEPNLEAFASRILHDVGPADARDDIAFVAIRRARRWPCGASGALSPRFGHGRNGYPTGTTCRR